jgi:membrane peptidoglycan carboxypeptidase
VTSRADDFGVQYDDEDASRRGRHGNAGAPSGAGAGSVPSGVDYDLGYADPGWDTQGFRTPGGPAGGAPGGAAPYGNSGPYSNAPLNSGPYNRPSYNSGGPGGNSGGPGGPYNSGPHRGPGPAQDFGQTEVYNPPEMFSPPGGYRPADDYNLPVGPPTPGRHGSRSGGPGGPPGGPRGPRGRKVKIKGSWWRHWSVKKVLALLAAMIGTFVVAIAIVVAYLYSSTQVPSAMAADTFQESTVYAANGTTVLGHLGTTDRQLITYSQVPPQIIYSVLAIEDHNYFHEGGISPTGILRAAYADLNGEDLQGGSTITQEFVRQYYANIGTQQTASRKIKEIFVAMKLAKSESKQWILQNYLNTIYLGQNSYGIAAAAQTYFNIPVSKLSTMTWSQSALLAAVIQQPTNYPLPQYRSNFEARWQTVRADLLKDGWITQAQYNAMAFPTFGDHVPQSFGPEVWAPYVMNVVQQELENPQTYNISEAELENGGYKIVTTIDPSKMNALYSSVQDQEEVMSEDGEGLQTYMHVGALLEDPATGGIQAMYAGPGYVGYRYNGVGKVITQKFCNEINCQDNMAVYNQEQVGSSFKPYILSTAVKEGMDVKTSMLDGQDFVCIPPDSDLQASAKNAYPTTQGYPDQCPAGYDPMSNDSADENGAFSPLNAMTNSVNTAYADLWHYVGGDHVAAMAQEFGVNTNQAGITGGQHPMVNEAGVALGQASLTVADQATMLATLDDAGVYHAVHIVGSITKDGTVVPLQVASHPVFSNDLETNSEMDTQVQYAMSEVAYEGTAAGVAGMNDGRPIISKTGTTNTAQSAFFIGAIPQDALAVALFTDQQNGVASSESLNGLGGITQAFGGTWPAAIWHTYAEDEWAELPAEQFTSPVFTGATWKLAPASLTTPKKTKKKAHKGGSTTGHGPSGNASPSPTPSSTCSGGAVNCGPPYSTPPATIPTPSPSAPDPSPSTGLPAILGTSPGGGATQAGAATAGTVVLLPVTLLWVRRRQHRKPPGRG